MIDGIGNAIHHKVRIGHAICIPAKAAYLFQKKRPFVNPDFREIIRIRGHHKVPFMITDIPFQGGHINSRYGRGRVIHKEQMPQRKTQAKKPQYQKENAQHEHTEKPLQCRKRAFLPFRRGEMRERKSRKSHQDHDPFLERFFPSKDMSISHLLALFHVSCCSGVR